MVADRDDDDIPNKKSSRKRGRNPLSHARGKQQSHENIWFRRTRAGFSLMVQYYAGQPPGTVGDGNVKHDTAASVAPAAKQSVGSGGSRAAKRRKKKKKQNSAPDVNEIAPAKPQEEEATAGPSADPSHPLLQALKKTAESDPKALALQRFLESMAQPLPATFRIRRSLEDFEPLQSQIQNDFSTLVQPLPFGNNMLYQVNCSKSDLRKHPNLKQFLVNNSQNGSIARQELGSMLPLLALEASGCLDAASKKKKYRILDVCASPGSKTLQALELLQNSPKSRILANDVSESRLQTLREAIPRSGMTTTAQIGYSCQDGRHISTTKQWHVIVCDVPCSGDGTVRKDPHVADMWKPEQGHVLHTTQLQILRRALLLLKPGGTLCYSTCSLNPTENEAVVAAALDHSKDDTIELLEFPDIPGFQRRPGISYWRVADYVANNNDNDDDETPHLVWCDSYKDAKAANMPHAVPTLWPSSSSSALPLDRCTRLWPQDHDSGGFFLALFRKK